MKRWIASALILMLLLLCGCGAKSSPTPTAAAPAPTDAAAGETFAFATTDLEGNPVSSADYKNAKVIMVNMWEPWCGPCVNEMPDLQALYEKYQAQGFLILGVTTSPAADVSSVVSQLGITYPVINGNAQFAQFKTGYVPTTVFLDGEGHILSAEPYIGGRASGDWEEIIVAYLQG